jgi:hypothetical protein
VEDAIKLLGLLWTSISASAAWCTTEALPLRITLGGHCPVVGWLCCGPRVAPDCGLDMDILTISLGSMTYLLRVYLRLVL